MEQQQEILDAPVASKVAVYNPIEAGIKAMLEKHGSVLTNPPVVTGNSTALEAVKTSRKELIKFRTTLEKTRVSEKAASLEYGKLVDAEAKRIQAFATPLELAYDAIVTAEETRLEAIRQQELEAERTRIAGHKERIQAIKEVRETANMCRTAERVKQLIDGMPALFEGSFEEFQEEALTAFNEVCTVLQQLHDTKVEAEAQAVELKRQQEELAAQRAEQVERDRAAAAARAEEEEQAKSRRDAEEAELQAKREAFEQEQAEARRLHQVEVDRLASKQREIDAQKERAAAELLAASQPAPLTAQDIADGVVDAEVKPAVHANGSPMFSTTTFKENGEPIMLDDQGKRSVFCDLNDDIAEPTQPTLRLGQINERLTPIQLTADGLRTLGFEPAGRERAAVLYHEQDFERICRALVEHIENVCEPVAA